MGAIGKLTPELIEKAERLIKFGNYDVVVYQSLGISHQTWHNWLNEGKTASSGLKLEFFETVTRARNKAEEAAVAAWRNQFEMDWRAASTFLARRYPARWMERKAIDLSTLSNAQLLALLGEDEAGGGGEEAGPEAGADGSDGEG